MGTAAGTARAPLGVAATLFWTVVALVPALLLTEVRVRWLVSGTVADQLVAILVPLSTLVVVAIAVGSAAAPLRNYVGLVRPRVRDVALGVAAQVTLSLIFAGALALAPAGNAMAQGDTGLPAVDPHFAAALVLFWIAKVLATPVCEEILWRGFLYRGLVTSPIGPFYAVVGIAVVFMLLHFPTDAAARAWHLACGLVYGGLRWSTGALTAPIAAHMFANALAAALVLAQV